MKRTDVLLLGLLSLMWGSSFLLIRVAVPGFGPASLVMLRVLLGAVLLFVYAKLAGQVLVFRPFAARFAMLGLLNAALPYVLISAAELHLSASFAAVLNATVPLFAAVFAAMWLSERLTLRRMLGLFAGVIGVGVMVGWSPMPMTGEAMASIAAMLVASASYAAAGIYTKRKMKGISVHSLAFGQQLGALMWMLVPGAALAPRAVPGPLALWSIVALGVVSTGIAYLLYFRLLERVGPTRTSTVTYLLPVVGMLWGVLLLGETVTTGMIGGLAVVMASVVLVNDIRLPSPVSAGWRAKRLAECVEGGMATDG